MSQSFQARRIANTSPVTSNYANFHSAQVRHVVIGNDMQIATSNPFFPHMQMSKKKIFFFFLKNKRMMMMNKKLQKYFQKKIMIINIREREIFK